MELFATWCELDETRRALLLENLAPNDARLHARLLVLIRADRDADEALFLSGDAVLDVVAAHPAEPLAERRGQRVGAWILERPLGSGGMGEVWLGRRSDGQHDGVAAIKMLRKMATDAHANQGFAQEGRILARLSHPNIAMMLDAGFTADGQRYLVLEFVDGVRIDQWCDSSRLGLSARLHLFLQVCAAVSHAHAHFIVHRDLKPSNMMVIGDGQVKLLDFGIARLLESDPGGLAQERGEAPAAFTPGHAAPEQISGGAITVATDVYALGVILFSLLGGRRPHGNAQSGPAQLARMVVDSEPRRLPEFEAMDDLVSIAAARHSTPDRLPRLLRGDLEMILAKALRKDPIERYASVQAFADDVRRHLERRPIAVRADSVLYRLGKFSRRHALVLGAAAVLAIVMLASALGLVVAAQRTAREAQATLAVKNFLFGLFSAVDPNEAKGRTISARELLDRGRDRLQSETQDDPALRAELQAVLGRIYSQLGLYAQARELQQQAVDAFKQGFDSPLRRAQAGIDLANTLRELGELDAAGAAVDAADLQLRSDSTAEPADRARVFNARSKIAVSRRDFSRAEVLADAAVKLARQEPVETYLLADSLWNAGSAAWGLKRLDQAESDYREALRLMTLSQGADSPRVGQLHGNLAMVMRSESRYGDALLEAEQGLAIDLKALGADHPRVLVDRANLGLTYYHLGHYGQASELLKGAATSQRELAGADDPALAGTLINLGLVLIEQADLAAAGDTFSRSLQIWTRRYGRDFPGAQAALAGLGTVNLLRGHLDQARLQLDEVQAADVKRGENDDYSLYQWRGELQRLRGDAQAAADIEREGLTRARQGTGERSRYTALSHHYLGLALRDKHDRADAIAELRNALKSFDYIPGAEHPWAATTRLELARLLATQPDTRAEAEELATEALSIRKKFLESEDPRIGEASTFLATLAH
jgi:eukaryotic-like serine/threonine-protein kinase